MGCRQYRSRQNKVPEWRTVPREANCCHPRAMALQRQSLEPQPPADRRALEVTARDRSQDTKSRKFTPGRRNGTQPVASDQVTKKAQERSEADIPTSKQTNKKANTQRQKAEAVHTRSTQGRKLAVTQAQKHATQSKKAHRKAEERRKEWELQREEWTRATGTPQKVVGTSATRAAGWG